MKIELSDKQAEFLMRALLQNYAATEEDYDGKEGLGASSTGEFIIGKLVAADFKLHNTFCTIKDERWKKRDPLNRYIFWGNGYHSSVSGNYLHKRLQQAFITQGGMQQNGGMGTEFDEQSDKEDKATLISVAKDILVGLGLTVDDLK